MFDLGISDFLWRSFGSRNEAQIWHEVIFSENADKDLLRSEFPDLFPSPRPEFECGDYSEVTAEQRLLGITIFEGKLDWVISRGAKVVRRAVGNEQWTMSDHKYVLMDFLI